MVDKGEERRQPASVGIVAQRVPERAQAQRGGAGSSEAMAVPTSLCMCSHGERPRMGRAGRSHRRWHTATFVGCTL